ncbi:MAG: hypothetical protein RL490_1483 [Pseudomonadota bacterium]|jgi:PAS domain S-box-containing protein
MTTTNFDHLGGTDAETLVAVYERRLRRAEMARAEAELLLERHSRVLARSNRELTQRESDLVARLEQGNRHLLHAQQTAAIASFHMDRGAVPFVSSQFFKLIGFEDKGAFDPDILLRLIHPLDRARIAAASQAFFATAQPGQDYRFEHRLERGGDGLRWLRWHIRIMRDGEGHFQSVFGTLQDITEARTTDRRARALQLIADRRTAQLMRLTDDLRRAKAEADAVYGAHSRFLAMTSHDIRTPLNGLLGMIEMLSASELPPMQRRMVDMMRDAGDQLRLLVGDIIDIADMGAGELQLTPEPIRLANLFDPLAALWQLRHPGHALRWQVDPTLPDLLLLDGRRVRQMLEGLLGDCEAGPVALAATRVGDMMRISLTAETLRDEGDSGQGRVIARRIANAMGGTVAEGAMPTIHMPIVASPDMAAPASVQVEPVPLRVAGRVPHVLIAEDVETNRIVLGSLLERMGCSHAFAVDGVVAVAAVANGAFDAVLMDVMMPNMDGAEATQRIRAMAGPEAQIPIIGVTAHGLQAERDALLAKGMNVCLTKPVDTAQLRDALVSLWARRGDTRVQDSPIDEAVFTAAFAALPPQRRQGLLDQALGDCRAQAQALLVAQGKDDVTARRRAAHSLKGVAGHFGASAILVALAALTDDSDPAPVLDAVNRVEQAAKTLFADARLHLAA